MSYHLGFLCVPVFTVGEQYQKVVPGWVVMSRFMHTSPAPYLNYCPFFILLYNFYIFNLPDSSFRQGCVLCLRVYIFFHISTTKTSNNVVISFISDRTLHTYQNSRTRSPEIYFNMFKPIQSLFGLSHYQVHTT